MTTETQKLLGADNRIIQSNTRIAAMLATKPAANIKALDAALKRLTASEICAYQESKSLAQSSGVLSLEEAQTVYAIMQGWDTAPLEQRMTVTSLMGQLMGVKVS